MIFTLTLVVELYSEFGFNPLPSRERGGKRMVSPRFIHHEVIDKRMVRDVYYMQICAY